MSRWLKFAVAASFFCFSGVGSYRGVANSTEVLRRNALLSRKRRYLTFPEGSNFVVTPSYIKPLLQVQPQGWTVLQECDLPFALPHDAKFFRDKKKPKRKEIERRHVHSQLKIALKRFGFDAENCLLRMICDIRKSNYMRRKKSLLKDVLYAALVDLTDKKIKCDEEKIWDQCDIPFIDIVLGYKGGNEKMQATDDNDIIWK